MTLDFIRLMDDNGVEHREGANGWEQTYCPFCYKNDGVMGLGWNRTSGTFNCFRCGKLDRWDTVAKMLGASLKKAGEICRRYESHMKSHPGLSDALRAILPTKNSLKIPYGTGPMAALHRDYLKQRGFDPALLEAEWGLLGTGPLGEHKFRIVIPVEQGGRQVCYQTRDVTGRAKAKYLSCHDADAVVPLKSCLYGLDKCAGNNWVVITEGPTKVWRLGTGAVATFGATVSDEQVAALKRFERRVIIFDHDEAGMDGAARLANQLAVFGGQTEALWIQGVRDVAEVNDGDALRLMRHVAENK